MIDIGKQTVKISCSKCSRAINVSIKKVANEALINCICGNGIQLKDSNGSSKKAINEINKSFQDFERTLRKLGK